MANGQQSRLPEFDLLRKQQQQRTIQQEQRTRDAIRRRFAALGGLQSGAAIKAEQLGAEEVRRRAGEEQARLGLAEASVARQQQFASGEAQKQREFQAAQADIGRKFQKEAFEFEKKMRQQGIDLQRSQLDLDREVTEFNKMIATAELNRPTDLFSNLLGFNPLSGLGKTGSKAGTGALVGAGIGAAFGGPVGAGIGGAVGGGLGLF